jgi:hypothetical protein
VCDTKYFKVEFLRKICKNGRNFDREEERERKKLALLVEESQNIMSAIFWFYSTVISRLQ